MNSSSKIVRQITQLTEKLERISRPIVFTNGCFDILHRGHVDYLEQAADLGESLVVGVNSDASVRRLDKGSNRPIIALEDRLAILAALESTTIVVAFDDDTPLKLIELIKPDYLVKGGDWNKQDIVGADFVEQHGGAVHSIPFRFNLSTSQIIESIRNPGKV